MRHSGQLCSNTRAELCTLHAALELVESQTGDLATGLVVVCLFCMLSVLAPTMVSDVERDEPVQMCTT